MRTPYLLCATLCAFSPAVTGQPRWTNVPFNAPTAGQSCAMVFDTVRGRAVLFGGMGPGVAATAHDQTWEWDGTAWEQRFPPYASPPGRVGHAMAWDAARGRAVLFGGEGGLGDTWEWDGTVWHPRETPVAPSPREGHAMAYDPTRSRVVLFGGDTGSATADDTWEWDGSAWTRISPAIRPPARENAAMIWDAARARTVLHGGVGAGGLLGDTWEWDGTSWTERPAAGGPPRSHHGGFFDAGRGRVVIHGGRTELIPPFLFRTPVLSDETWEYDGSSWTVLAPSTGTPARGSFASAWDSVRGRGIVYGGEVSTVAVSRNTYEWDGSSWSHRAGGPEERLDHGLSYDEARQRLVVMGGLRNNINSTPRDAYSDTWEWDGTTWHPRSPFPGGPRIRHAMAYDPTRQVTVVFGGARTIKAGNTQLQDTWTWDGTTWVQRFPSNQPSARMHHQMVAVRDRLLLFGGQTWDTPLSIYVNDTWTWDGTEWTLHTPAIKPPERGEHGMAYDSRRDRVVLFGGRDVTNTRLADTWEWDGQTWIQENPATVPPARSHHIMVYDAYRERVVMHGGSGATGDVWEWDGVDWTRRTAASPSLLLGAGAAFDSAGRQVARFGGGGSANSDELWLLATAEPADYASFGAGCTGTAGTPTLAAEQARVPWAGSTFSAQLTPIPNGAPAVLAFGASNTAWGALALPLVLPGTGSPGCEILVSLDVVVPMVNSGAGAFLTLTVPSSPAFVGASYHNQAIVVDPGANTIGLTTSNGASARIGMR